MLEVEDFAGLIEDQISNDLDVFLAIDEDWDLLVKSLLLLLWKLIVEVMPFGLLEGNESAVLGDLPVCQPVHWVVDQLALFYLLHVL